MALSRNNSLFVKAKPLRSNYNKIYAVGSKIDPHVINHSSAHAEITNPPSLFSLKNKVNSTKLDFDDVLIVPKQTKLSSRKEVSLTRKIRFNNEVIWEGVPIISSNMDTVSNLSTFKVLKQHQYITCFPKYFNDIWFNTPELSRMPDDLKYTDNYMLSCGVSKSELTKMINIITRLASNNIHVKFICIDVANGYMDILEEACLYIRDKFPNIVIVAGNVVTADATYNLIKYAGVNIVKIGIGSGSVCTTRLKAGVGYPQLSAVLECSYAAHCAGGYIISDGGIVNPCDFSKAFGAGADFVMCGSIFASHNESPGEVITDNYTQMKYKTFYGMSSETANNKYNNGLQYYRSAEGKEVAVPLKGPLHNTLQDINGSIRSTCTYTNSKSIEELSINTQFVKVNHHHNTSLN